MLKVGVLGAGHLGKIHLRLLNQSKKYELVKNKEEKTSELENLETSFHKELEKRFEEKSIQ